jgi:hypothetical protein
MTDEISVETQARELGWSPKEEFKGDPERWIDAETFVKRGEELMPILKANNRKLLGEVMSLKEAVKASQDSISALKEFNSKINIREAKETKKVLVEQLKEARSDGDVETELKLTKEIDKTEKALEVAETKPVEQPVAPATDPVFIAWKEEHPWFGQDKRKTNIAIAIGNELRSDPESRNLTGRAFLDKVIQELNKTLPSAERTPAQSKVEGGRGSGNSGGPSGSGKTFNDLPSEAKDACDRQALRLVGPNRAFKNQAEWRSHYAAKYFTQEAS